MNLNKYSRKISDGFTEERWKGFVDTPDEKKENYLSSIIEENASAKQNLRFAEKQLLDEFVREYPEKAIYFGDELDEYATLQALKKDDVYGEVYKEIVSPLVSKANDYTWLTNQMNEHLGYPYGFESGGKAYRRNKTSDSRRVSDGENLSKRLSKSDIDYLLSEGNKEDDLEQIEESLDYATFEIFQLNDRYEEGSNKEVSFGKAINFVGRKGVLSALARAAFHRSGTYEDNRKGVHVYIDKSFWD